MHIATKGSKFDISEEKSTANIASRLSTILKKGDIVFFYGEMGVGKTTFIRHLINSFQNEKKLELIEVTSPTFNLVNEYETKNFLIQHFDLFRLKNENEIQNIGLFENYKDILTLIEWPEKISKVPNNIIKLFFAYKKNF